MEAGESDAVRPQGEECDAESGGDCSDDEALPPQKPRGPGQASEAKKEEHENTHLPCRSWCHAREGRGRQRLRT